MIHKSGDIFKDDWLCSPFCTVERDTGSLTLRSRKQVDSNNYVILKLPVNRPDQDLRIEYECMSERPSDLSPILGGSNFGGGLNPDETGYFFGYGCGSGENSFQRKTVTIMTNRKVWPRPNTWYRCILERTGGRFLFSVNGKPVFEYFDPQPVFGTNCMFFSFYFFGQQAMLRKVTVSVRKSLLDYEKLSQMNQHHVVFKNNPNRLYEIRWTTGFWMASQARLVFFKDISQYMDLEKQKRIRSGEVKNMQLERAREYIVGHFDRNINYKELCKNYYMSYSHFITSFRKAYGVSPKDYQIELRLKRAKQMLTSGQYKIKEVALLSGYEDERGFYQIFVKREGITPTDYIKKNRI